MNVKKGIPYIKHLGTEMMETLATSDIAYYDPFIPEIWETREYADYTGMKTVEWNEDIVSGFDA